MRKNIPTPESLRKLLRYNQETGQLFWRKRPVWLFKEGKHTAEHRCNIWNTKHAGKEAFTAIMASGYRFGTTFGRPYLAHRVIFAMQTGAWPKNQIDHIDHVRDDNRWKNLREATCRENSQNLTMRETNTSGICGVRWEKARKKWAAEIRMNGKTIHLGRFPDKSDVIKARQAANIKFGFHENHGREKAG